MKFAVLAMVKNEVDIIESFVRHNLQFADEMFILDNGSTDNTYVILQHLKNEGLPIHLFQDVTIGYQQQKLSTDLLHNIKDKTDADIFMFLDADEFICIHPNSPIYSSQDQHKEFFQSQLAKVKQFGSYAIKWLNYLPIEVDQDDYINHFDEFYECNQTLLIHQKVIYAREMLEHITLSQGNHFLYKKDTNELIHQMVFDDIALAHFPIRSPKQAINKVLTTSLAVSSRKLGEGESFHIFDMQEKIVNNNYQLSMDECRELVCTYGVPQEYKERITIGSGRINPSIAINLKYSDLNNLNTIHSLRLMAETFSDNIKELSRNLSESQRELNTLKVAIDKHENLRELASIKQHNQGLLFRIYKMEKQTDASLPASQVADLASDRLKSVYKSPTYQIIRTFKKFGWLLRGKPKKPYYYPKTESETNKEIYKILWSPEWNFFGWIHVIYTLIKKIFRVR